jgi:N-glycosylase/DNA lyase
MRYSHVDSILADHTLQVIPIRTRLAEFAAVPPDHWFYELAYCLLTPQSSAVNASRAVDELQKGDFLSHGFDPTPVLRDRKGYIRFHNTKARRLLEARLLYPLLQTEISKTRIQDDTYTSGGVAIRQWLVEHVNGLGWKEASHFLRNIGFKNLAILDRHILKNLKHHGVLRTVPKTLTPARYRTIEESFLKFSGTIGIPMDELDLLFWSRETGEIRK